MLPVRPLLTESALHGICSVCQLVVQVTHHQLEQMREAEQSQRAAEAKEREMAAKREVSADQYSRMVDVENINRQDDGGESSRVGTVSTTSATCSGRNRVRGRGPTGNTARSM